MNFKCQITYKTESGSQRVAVEYINAPNSIQAKSRAQGMYANIVRVTVNVVRVMG